MHVKERMTDGTLSEDSTYAIVAVGDSPEITSNDAIEETLSCNDPQDLLVKKTVIQSDILDGLMIVEKVLAPTTLTLVDVAKPSEQPLTASNSSKVISSNIFGPKQKSLKGNAIATKEGNDFFDPLFNPPPLPPKQPWAASLMLIVPLRLGKDKTDPENFHVMNCLQASFA